MLLMWDAELGSPLSPLTTGESTGYQEMLLELFSTHSKPGKEDKVVYIDGSWDLFHAGHITMLERARSLGDYLIVGVFSDADAARIASEVKVMTLHERALSLLACKVSSTNAVYRLCDT
jgi:cytidyltransferase-like protein